jgi:UDP-glucose 4-epimerase
MGVLVTGGAGYIGSHMTYALLERGEQVVVLDNLTTGVHGLISPKALFVKGDVADKDLVSDLIRRHAIDAVIHFAGSVVVPESVECPLFYYHNNTVASRSLIESCVATGMRNFVFSSTAAVYGMPKDGIVTETTAPNPINPYGRSKLMTEWMLGDVALAHDFRYVALRYFNVAGADPEGRTGQSSPRATHLIKRACQAALGRIPGLEIFGADFPTPDGTGVRDYIHVMDLVDAHILALASLRADGPSEIYNCGYGRGLSVREIVRSVETASNQAIPVSVAPRRPGDPPMIVANSAKLKTDLGWCPRFSDLNKIVGSAFEWERRLNSSS